MAETTVDTWHQIAMSLRGAYLAMHRQAETEFARFGITAEQFVVLAVLRDGAVLSQAEVGRRTYSDPNTMGAMLALMEARGLVRRMKHPGDRRVRTVTATRKGKHIFAKVLGHRDATRRRMEGVFTPAEVEAFIGFLQRVMWGISHRKTALGGGRAKD
jgi:DNA-binding MarR family transcriptional regulator